MFHVKREKGCIERVKNKFDAMILATVLTTIFYSATYPFIHKHIVSEVSDFVLAANQIVNCLSVVAFSFLWNKRSEKIFKLYPIFCIAETVLVILASIWATLTNDIFSYYIMDTIIFSIVTRNIICGNVKLRSMRYIKENDRMQFDNNINSASAVATIIGSFIAMMLNLDFVQMLWIATAGNLIDNIFYICIYYSEIRKNVSRET